MYQDSIEFSGFLKIIWYTLRVETLKCTRVLQVSSGFLKKSGTLGWLRLLGVPEFYRVLWFFKKTLVHLGVRGSWVYQIFMVFSGFSKNLVHFGE